MLRVSKLLTKQELDALARRFHSLQEPTVELPPIVAVPSRALRARDHAEVCSAVEESIETAFAGKLRTVRLAFKAIGEREFRFKICINSAELISHTSQRGKNSALINCRKRLIIVVPPERRAANTGCLPLDMNAPPHPYHPL